MFTVQGVGILIGDEQTTVLGRGAEPGEEWIVIEPSVVCASSMAAAVDVLLAGREAVATGFDPLLRHPRRQQYSGSEPEVMVELLTTLLATLRQQVPLGADEPLRVRPVLVVPFTTPATAVEALARAARQAGWGDVWVVSDLLALAAAQSERSRERSRERPGGDGPVAVAVSDRGWMHEARWAVGPAGAKEQYRLDRLSSHPVDEGGQSAPPSEESLARGGAILSAAGGRVWSVSPQLHLFIGLAGPGSDVLPLGTVEEGVCLVRAFHGPPPGGALIRLVVGAQPHPAACQTVAETWVEPDADEPTDGIWLLQVSIAAGLTGELTIRPPSDRPPVRIPFQVRLP